MDSPEDPVRRDGPPSKLRRRRLRLLTALVAVSAALAIGKAAPGIADAVRLGLAERDIVLGRFDEAEAKLDVLIARHPMRPRPRFLLARVARLQGRITDAEEALGWAVALGMPIDEARPEHDALVSMGELGDDWRSARLDPETSTADR
jgi:hypothetical protein